MMTNLPARNVPLRTYSRRVKIKTENHAGLKRSIEELSEDVTTEVLVLPKHIKKSSIQSYFKPLPTPPSSDFVDRDGAGFGIVKGAEGVHDENANLSDDGSVGTGRPRKVRRRMKAKVQLAPIQNIPDNCVDTSPLRKQDTTTLSAVHACKKVGHIGLSDRSGDPSWTANNAGIKITAARKYAKSRTQQALLDLSVSAFVECRICKMQYNQTDKGDRTSHSKFHSEYLHGKQSTSHNQSTVLYSEYFSGTKSSSSRKSSPGDHHEIRAVDRAATTEQRSQLQAALKLSYNDMDGIRLKDEELWSEIIDPRSGNDGKNVARFKLFVYYINREVAAVLLVERVSQGFEFDGNEVSNRIHQVHLGVERIWVKQSYRGQGLATKLLDCARENSIQGLFLSKKDIAFSAPTKDGQHFARSYARGVLAGVSFLIAL